MDGIPNINFVANPADVLTMPVDKTLSIEGEAADAKAVGDALAGKADKSEIATAITVNGQGADLQGEIIVLAEHIPMDAGASAASVGGEIVALKGRTGADIPVSGEAGARSIADAIGEIDSGASVTGGVLTLPGSVTDSSTEVHGALVGGEALPIRDAGAVRSINGQEPDGNGNVSITHVENATNLVADDAQSNIGIFLMRTSGGTTPISNGSAWLARLRGRIEHTGQVEEVLTCVVNAASREAGADPITATIDPAVFKAAVSESVVYTLTYTTTWSANPALIGVTVTGQPVDGDEIVVTYVKAARGHITPATPTELRSTGWNLYSHANGYARVLAYSETYGYRVEGAYTGLAYSETLNGARQTISPVNGNFNVPGDGYVWVTGGDATSTCIYMTWSDWTTGHTGAFEAYRESVIDLSDIMAEVYPDGLLAVGAVADEVDFALQTATVAVEVMAYSEEAIAALEQAGRAYEADEDTIYAVLETPRTVSISLGNQYTVNDHGMELFAGSDIAVEAHMLYGQNLRDKLRGDVVTLSQQSLTSAQQAQVRTNLDVYSKTEVGNKLSSEAVILAQQSLTTAQKTQVRTNLDVYGAGEVDDMFGGETVTSGIFTPASGITVNRERLEVIGKLHILQLDLRSSDTISARMDLGTVASDYNAGRATNAVVCPCSSAINGYVDGVVNCLMRANGSIQAVYLGNAYKEVYITLVYFK